VQSGRERLSVLCLLVALVAGPGLANESPGPDSHQYATIIMAGKKTGYMVTEREKDDKTACSTTRMVVTPHHGVMKLVFDTTYRCAATLDGKPVSLHLTILIL
jgi:hypothetical protein